MGREDDQARARPGGRMTALLVSAGMVLLAGAFVDVVWTAVAAGSGAGPLTGRLARSMWRGALRLHAVTGRSSALTAAGPIIVLSILLTWILLTMTGWLLIFTSTRGAVRAASTGEPGDLVDRMYFTGYTIVTLGLGDYVSGDGLWQLATVLAAASGLTLITLSITYLIPVASAVVQRRQLPGQLSALGPSSHDIVIRAWNGRTFGSLGQNLSMLLPLLHRLRLQHLTYPPVHYFRSDSAQESTAVNLTNLGHTVGLLRHGIAEGVRPDTQTIDAIGAAIDAFLATMDGAHISSGGEVVQPPSLGPLIDAGIPVDESAYESYIRESVHRRQLLGSYLHNNGWKPSDVPGSSV